MKYFFTNQNKNICKLRVFSSIAGRGVSSDFVRRKCKNRQKLAYVRRRRKSKATTAWLTRVTLSATHSLFHNVLSLRTMSGRFCLIRCESFDRKDRFHETYKRQKTFLISRKAWNLSFLSDILGCVECKRDGDEKNCEKLKWSSD